MWALVRVVVRRHELGSQRGFGRGSSGAAVEQVPDRPLRCEGVWACTCLRVSYQLISSEAASAAAGKRRSHTRLGRPCGKAGIDLSADIRGTDLLRERVAACSIVGESAAGYCEALRLVAFDTLQRAYRYVAADAAAGVCWAI